MKRRDIWVSCVCVNQCCEQIAHIFRRKKDCWAEKCELSQLYYSLQPSPSSRHIKGVCLHSTICLPSRKKKKKKFQKNRDVFLTLWAIHVQLPESHPTLQRENPGKIVLGELVSAPRHSGCLLLTVTVSKHTNICMLTPLNNPRYVQLAQYAQCKSIRPDGLLAGVILSGLCAAAWHSMPPTNGG